MSGEKQVFELTGGALCLDFANTMGDRPRCTEEHLLRWTDLVTWGVHTSALSPRDASALRKWAVADERAADAALGVAKDLRETIYRIFAAVAARRPVSAGDLAVLNRWLGESLTHLRVLPASDGYGWGWEPSVDSTRLFWPVVWSAARLLVSDERSDVRECASDRCSWLFLDRSRTKKRRWCSMRTCGNRAKVHRFQERRRRAASGVASGSPRPAAAITRCAPDRAA